MRCWLLAIFSLSGLAAAQEPATLSLVTRIPMPEVGGRLDHLSVDLEGRRLFVAAVDNGSVEIIDLAAGKRVHTITRLSEPQGVYFDAATHRLFVACGGDGRTHIYDGTTFRQVASVKFSADADNIRYDARDHLAVVGHAGAKHVFGLKEEGTGALGFIDASGKVVREVGVDAHPESFQLERTGTRVFVNVPEKHEIEVMDLAQGREAAAPMRWSVTGVDDNFPMALDEAHHRLFVGGWTPPSLLVLDTDSGKPVETVSISGRSDDLFYDAARQRIYVLTDAGGIHVVQQDDPDRYRLIGKLATPKGAETGLFVPQWNELFNAVRADAGQPAQIMVYATK